MVAVLIVMVGQVGKFDCSIRAVQAGSDKSRARGCTRGTIFFYTELSAAVTAISCRRGFHVNIYRIFVLGRCAYVPFLVIGIIGVFLYSFRAILVLDGR